MTRNIVKPLSAVSCGLLLPAWALADSGVGVDTWRANKLDPTGGMASAECDPDGTSWLEAGEHRSPTGNLYNCPPALPLLTTIGNEWEHYGVLQLGYIGTGADRFALWNRYTDWQANQPVLGLLDLHFESPYIGSYADVRGSRLSDDDQYYEAVYGQAGAYKVEAFLRDMPNLLSTDARPIWSGVGTSNLTLPSSLMPGLSTSAQVAAISAATPERTLKVVRDKQGLDVSGYLSPQWTGYLTFSHEARKGEQPYGGPFGYDWPPFSGAIVETVKPIDDYTINLNTGFRYAGTLWRADFGYSGSYYRDHYLSYSFQQPFFIPSSAPSGAIAAPLTDGQMSMEPNNDYHNVHVTMTRMTSLNGELSLTVSEVLMTQRDNLIPPTNCQGYLGWGTPARGSTQLQPGDVGGQNPNLVACSQWNTTAALSQTKADVNMHNTLAQAGLVLRPRSDLSVDTGFKFYRQAYYNNYIAYNPLNGDYGYIAENGAFLRAYGYPLSFTNGSFPPGANIVDGRVAPYLLSMDDYNIHGSATWQATERDTLGVLYIFDEYRPTSRERDNVDDNSLKLTWVDKSLDWLTFRANYTFLRRTGSVYNNDVYGYTFLAALPGFSQAYPTFVVPPETVNQLRVYDIANRTENKLDLMATMAARDDLTVTASFRGDWNRNPVLIGQQGYNTLSTQISVEWMPTTTDQASAYIGYDHSTLSMANVAGAVGNVVCPDLGCPYYPDANRWWESDHERNQYAGVTLLHRMHRATLDLGWNYIYSRGLIDYSAASPGALVYPSEFATMGSGFPAMTYRVSSVNIGATMQLNSRVRVRLFDNYEIGRIADWHYDGFNQGLVVGNTLYTDGGPQSYTENLIGAMVSVQL